MRARAHTHTQKKKEAALQVALGLFLSIPRKAPLEVFFRVIELIVWVKI